DHRLQHTERAAYIVPVVAQRIADRFAHVEERRKMHHGEAFVASEGGGESRRIGDVALHELAVLHGLPVAGQQIVEDNDAVAGTEAPSSSSRSMIGMAGASRMSSVRGLNARPHNANVRPFMVLKWRSILSTSRCFCTSLTASTASKVLKSYPFSAADLSSAFTSFGKQLPP